MKAVMVMFDSLNRHMLPPYGCEWVHAPNFRRLAGESVTFDRCFVGSMPCMPARRELHTGRYNFLHRGWGPLEPFDDSMPEILKNSGVYSHLTSDHYHYWEDGGATYHGRYSSWEISRGQEGDPWKPLPAGIRLPDSVNLRLRGERARQDFINRSFMPGEDDQPQAVTFARGLEFLENNHRGDNWFLHIETFDPHEPYFSPERYRALYPHDYRDPHFDWPSYGPVGEPPETVRHLRLENAALVSMCDAWLGKVLDAFDEYGLWNDTMLIVNTDHGFLLGEHDFWGKCSMPFYNEVAMAPLFIRDPRSGRRGERNDCLVQAIDLPATLLDFFGLPRPAAMQGRPLGDVIADGAPVRDAALFGIHGGHVNCTDGRYVYMRAPAGPENRPLNNYTLMPTHMRGFFSPEELSGASLAGPFSFSRGCRLLRVPCHGERDYHRFETMLFDLSGDPGQEAPLADATAEAMMAAHLARLMRENDAPPEQFERLGLGKA